MFCPAEADAEDDDGKAEQEYGEIAVFPIQLRHVFEIHAIPACNERQGEKDGGDDGEDFHDFILPGDGIADFFYDTKDIVSVINEYDAIFKNRIAEGSLIGVFPFGRNDEGAI